MTQSDALPIKVGSVPNCHSPGPGVDAGPDAPVIALVGAPNAGKSTLFNALTGANVTMGNWPGTTVEVARGAWRPTVDHDCAAQGCTCTENCSCPATETAGWTLLDLPGAYSLDPISPDEALTRALLVDCPPAERPDLVVVTADAANLTRSLYLPAQLREHRLRVVLALTMGDVAAQRGITVDTAALSRAIGCPVLMIDPRRRNGMGELAQVIADQLRRPVPAPRSRDLSVTEDGAEPDELDIDDERFAWIEEVVAQSTHHADPGRRTWSDRVDRWATAPVIGPVLFLLVMWCVFQITTTVAAPIQDALSGLFSGPISDGAGWLLTQIGLGDTWVRGLIVDGLIAGVGMVLTFVPLMTLMFVLLAILEDSGYLARAAVVTDRVMRAVGLPGRAFLPLIVGFGCNVPAISATRILPDAKHRLLTALLVPFTSCSARLTVYVLVATTFFGQYAGTVVFAMYLISILFVVGVGLLLKNTVWRTMGASPLVIDLPAYHWPTARITAAVTWQRLKGFLKTASGIIVVAVCVVWALQAIPARGGADFGQVAVEDSAYGVAAQAIAPVFEPTGFGSWQTTSALVVGFMAKEAVISSWAQTYAVSDPTTGGSAADLGTQIIASFTESSGGHPYPAVWAFLIFLLAYTPCVATLAAQKREIGLKWTLFGIAVQLSLAWLVATAVFQIGRVFW